MACDKSINCVNPPDFPDISSETEPVIVNAQVSLSFSCFSGYAISLPAWIRYDSDTDTLIGSAGFWIGNTQEEATALAQTKLQEFADAVIGSFTAGSCDVVIEGDAEIGGGDTFDCYPEQDNVFCLPEAGTGFDGGWMFSDDPFGIVFGETFDVYTDQDPLEVPLGLGAGFEGKWALGDGL